MSQLRRGEEIIREIDYIGSEAIIIRADVYIAGQIIVINGGRINYLSHSLYVL